MLLDKALGVLRSDNADVSAALMAAESAAARNAAELEAARQELAIRGASAIDVDVQRRRAESALDAERRAGQLTTAELTIKSQQLDAVKEENQRLVHEVESLNAHIKSLEASLREKTTAVAQAEQQVAKWEQQQQQQHQRQQQQQQLEQKAVLPDRNLRELDLNRDRNTNATRDTSLGVYTHSANMRIPNNIPNNNTGIRSKDTDSANGGTSTTSTRYQPMPVQIATSVDPPLAPEGGSPVRRPGSAMRELLSDRQLNSTNNNRSTNSNSTTNAAAPIIQWHQHSSYAMPIPPQATALPSTREAPPPQQQQQMRPAMVQSQREPSKPSIPIQKETSNLQVSHKQQEQGHLQQSMKQHQPQFSQEHMTYLDSAKVK